ncbi:hypothetical protein B5G28_07620 [Faecalibacterium sp. An77]|uniref:hypothetical protein n=1 Tax=Faecalibacterium sp. An77 TaxID=1965655 RepID=UPI000B38D876|nr:hypothetical protein [Faecalibacterium sp. An77]OUN38907.1 hypothetical protein B5G28_07620 [Faecalibacterium sp. An77]
MERKTKMKRFFALVLAAALTLSLAGCESIKNGVASLMGFSNTAQEADTENWAAATTDPIMLPEGTDSTAQWANVVSNGTLYGIYNGIWKRNTGYFQVAGDTLTITACGTAEGVQEYKLALWKKVDGGAQYVDGSTGYIRTDGTNYRYTITGLDPSAQYRITVSYDSSRYYLYGMFAAEGIVG